MTFRVLTWNLQGSRRPDLEAVAIVVRDALADVVVLQEVQRSQAAYLAAAAGWRSTWRFKHWPVVHPAEGLAVLAPERPLRTRTVCLARFASFWSWRRRIAVTCEVATRLGPVTVVDVHLGAGVPDDERVRQALLTTGLVTDPRGVIAGDLNSRPDSPVLDAYAAAGLRDAWAEVNPAAPGATNWPGDRDRPPTQRLDYVLVGDGLRVVSAELPAPGAAGFERYAALSDHLPLVVTVESADAAAPPEGSGRRR